MTPESVAATNSPMLWPMNAPGTMPQRMKSVARAYDTVNIAGCV